MAILTGPEIRRRVEARDGSIVIDPFDPAKCGANSVDVHLGDELRVYQTGRYKLKETTIDPLAPPPTVVHPLLTGHKARPAAWKLTPGRVYLASTREYTETHGLVPVLYGRSSIGRLGLFVHVTAGFGDDGFKGWWVLELVATQPVLVRPGMRIGQIVYHTLEGDRAPYQGRYQNQPATPVASRFHLPEGGAA